MKKELSVQEALYKAESYCSTTEHCISEVTDKLVSWGISEEDIVQIIETLQKERFIDEQRFAIAFVRDKYRFNLWGRYKIRLYLQKKRISENLIEKALNEIDETEYLSLLAKELERKSRSVKARDNYERNIKLMRFAYGKGYEKEEIVHCLNQILHEDVDMD